MPNPSFSMNPAFTPDERQAGNWNRQPVPQGYQQQGHQAQQGFPQGPAYSPAYGQAPQPGYPVPPQAPNDGSLSPAQLEEMYGRPSATPGEMRRMSIDGVIVKTAITLGLVAVGFAITMSVMWLAMRGMAPAALFYVLTWGGALAGFVLGLVNAFKRNPNRALILSYALAQGLFLGGFSAMMEWGWGLDGIIFQALTATACVFGLTLALYAFRIVRTTPVITRIVLIAMGGYLLFSLVNVVLMLTGVNSDPWGLRGSVEIAGIPLGVILGAMAVLMGAYCLVMDFELAENGVKRGAPTKFEWSAAFGITADIIWLYVEILRIISLLRRD